MPSTSFSALINGPGNVRDILNDRDSTNYRYSDADLLQYANDALEAICRVRPDLFPRTGEIVCAPGEILQRIPSNATYLLTVLHNRNGPIINEIDRLQLDRFVPDWPRHPAGQTLNWARYDKSEYHFFVYPKAPANHSVVATWAEVLKRYEMEEICPLVGYDVPIKDYIIFRAETRDDESINTRRALAFQQMFNAALGISAAVRRTVETHRNPVKDDPAQ